ncbi:MAG: FAD-binding oxidoreductase, partial [Pseudomonadota bacterium]
MQLSGWGAYPKITTKLVAPRSAEALADLVAQSSQTAPGPLIARGAGRAYGDSAVSPGQTISMRGFDHLLAFDPDTGQLVAEAGVSLAKIIATTLPRGWFPMVTPGTKFVTLGGAIAADVHGKNHHQQGGFGSCVEWIEILTAEGETKRASASENSDLFDWTIGGMGLTGIILRAAIRLRPVSSAWITQQTLPMDNLGQVMAAFETHSAAPYSVAWIDCLAKGADLGRSLLLLGDHAPVEALPETARDRPLDCPAKPARALPAGLPGWALNRWSLRAFNSLYYAHQSRNAGEKLVDWDSYFYPLDAILGWNRIYGRQGFVQFQCVLPPDRAEPGLRALLSATAEAGRGSFLAVLKRMGPQDSRFSFPM